MDKQKKDPPDEKRIPQKTCSKQLQTHNVCLPMMWEILMAQIWEEIYQLKINCRLFLEEQKGSHKGKRRTGNLLHVDLHILKKSKNRHKNVAMACIDNKKANDMVPYRWMIDCRKMYKIPNEVIKTKDWNWQQEKKV